MNSFTLFMVSSENFSENDYTLPHTASPTH